MACTSCLTNCDPLVTDKCVRYTGPDIDALGVCKNTSWYEVGAIILDKIEAASNPTSIKYNTLTTTCSFITSLLIDKTAQPFSLQQFAEVVLDGFCDLDSKIVAITPIQYSFNTRCLAGTLTNRDQITQSLIDKICEVEETVSEIEDTYVKQSDFCAQVTACLPNIPSVDTSSSTQWNTRMVPYVYYDYGGPLSNFDNTGKGISANGFEKIYLANGLNGTQDRRGRSPIGAISNVPGATLDAVVDPNVVGNSAYNYVLGSKYGASSVILSTNQLPSHNHAVTDPGHKHFVISSTASGTKGVPSGTAIAWSSNRANGNQDYDLCSTSGAINAGESSKSATGITVAASGGGLAHPNLHPVVGTLFIVYIP